MAEAIQLVALNATGARKKWSCKPESRKVRHTGRKRRCVRSRGSCNTTNSLDEHTRRIYPIKWNDRKSWSVTHGNTCTRESTPCLQSHQRRCLVRFPFCGKFFPCYCCHNESDCTEDQARAANATHIRCTICYNEQVVRFYLRTEFKFSSLSFLRYTATKFLQMQSNRHV